MGKKSVRPDKNVYQLAREAMELTREKASEQMFISADRIEKIESGRSLPHPDEIMGMAECYHAPELCNYYCTRECRIGQEYVPEADMKDLPHITLQMLASLNALEKQKNRLIEITVDGEITEDEYLDFALIRHHMNNISASVESLKLWMNRMIYDGKIDKDKLDEASAKL